MATADDNFWVACEPPAWVDARGPSCCVESEHFVVRWGATGASTDRAARAAPNILVWLEQVWSLLCDPTSPDFFVVPYSAAGWCDDGLKRKINVYIGDTGLHPHPHDTGWAHQGTVDEDCPAVGHPRANPRNRLRHSYLALKPGAAEAERTCVHEFGHVLQLHTGGHVDSECVGYQWEAHAEYCTHLRNAAWAPHLPIFLRTAHLPVDMTNYDGEGEGGGRQYIVWPFYAYLDRVYGRGTANSLWHADFRQRCANPTGQSHDLITNLVNFCKWEVGGGVDGAAKRPACLRDLFGGFALASLTLDWACADRAHQADALLACADVLDPLRFTPLSKAACGVKPNTHGRPTVYDEDGAAWFVPDGSRPLKRLGFACHRIEVNENAQEVTLRLEAHAPSGGSPSSSSCDLILGVAGYHPTAKQRHYPVHDPTTESLPCAVIGGEAATVTFSPLPGYVYLLSVCAVCEDKDFVALKWGTPPQSLPTWRYSIGMLNCMPHKLVAALSPAVSDSVRKLAADESVLNADWSLVSPSTSAAERRRRVTHRHRHTLRQSE